MPSSMRLALLEEKTVYEIMEVFNQEYSVRPIVLICAQVVHGCSYVF